MSYRVTYKNILIGESDLEYGDPPMGVAFGQLRIAENITSCYEFLISLSVDDGVDVFEDLKEDGFCSVGFDYLEVRSNTGTVITGQGYNIAGFGRDFEVSILGIDGTLYVQEFEEHVKRYDDQFRDCT